MAASSIAASTALVLIDCQQSFVRGFWMAGVGQAEVEPLRAAFDRVASFLPSLSPDVRILVTQCPFPTPRDFDLYPPVHDALVARDQSRITRVIKPGNSVLRASGAIQWLDGAIRDGIRTVVVAGCTLTSCVRVSASDIHRRYAKSAGLRTCVDLNLCAARASNYVKRCDDCLRLYVEGFGDSSSCSCTVPGEVLKSPVDKTVMDLKSAGIEVFDAYDWTSCLV